jgi:hypothetical protein
MALSYESYPGNGVINTFSVPFQYLSKAHVKVYINGVEDTTFTWLTSASIQTSTIPPNGSVVLIERQTPTSPQVDFVDGSTLTESILDTATIQSLYVSEESKDSLTDVLQLDTGDNKVDAKNKVIKNVADPVNPQDAATKSWSESAVTSSVAQAANSAVAAANSASSAAVSAAVALDHTTFIAPGLGTIARSSNDKFSETVSVKDFGAIGDGVTDDTVAFNKATAYIRSKLETGTGGNNFYNIELLIPAATYVISSWDLTGLLGRSLCISGYGVKLFGNTAGVAVVDCIGSRWLRFSGIKVVSDTSVQPLCGIQIGPKGTETCGNNTFNDCEVLGYFSRAAFCNLGSETTQHFGCTYLNRTQSGTPYAYIGDGLSQFLPVSSYQTITRVANQALSFTNNTHYGCQIRNEGGAGDATFLAYTAGWFFDRNTYFLAFNNASVRLYGTTAYRNLDLHIDGLFESDFANVPSGSGNIGLRYAIALDGDGSGTAIDGLVINTLSPHCVTSFFTQTCAGTYRISNANIRVQSLRGASATFFTSGSGISLDGTIETRDAGKLNLNGIAKFNGLLKVNSFALLGKPVAGSYNVYDMATDKFILAGNSGATNRVYMYDGILFFDGVNTDVDAKVRGKGAGSVLLGNETKIDVLQVRALAGGTSGVLIDSQAVNPAIAATGSGANLDLQLAPKGTGNIRFGTHTANADAAITGYITVKDAGGTLRKLAVIA